MDGFDFYNPAIYSNTLYDYNDILEPAGWIVPDKVEMFNNNNTGDIYNYNTHMTPHCDNQQKATIEYSDEGRINSIECDSKIQNNNENKSKENA